MQLSKSCEELEVRLLYSGTTALLDSILPNSSLLYSTLLYFSLLFSTLLFSNLPYSELSSNKMCSILLYLYSTLIYSTLIYFTLFLFYSPILNSTLLHFILLYSCLKVVLRNSIPFCPISLHSTPLCYCGGLASPYPGARSSTKINLDSLLTLSTLDLTCQLSIYSESNLRTSFYVLH